MVQHRRAKANAVTAPLAHGTGTDQRGACFGTAFFRTLPMTQPCSQGGASFLDRVLLKAPSSDTICSSNLRNSSDWAMRRRRRADNCLPESSAAEILIFVNQFFITVLLG